MAGTGVTRFEDLDAWKLSTELRDLVYQMTESGRVLDDRRFRDQIRDAASGAPRNIAEGFGRFNPREFEQYTRWAKASLMETQNHLLHGKTEKYFSQADFEKAHRLSKRAVGATKGLNRYLRSCKGKLPWENQENQKPGNQNPRNQNPQNQNPEPLEPKGTPGTQGTPEPKEPRASEASE